MSELTIHVADCRPSFRPRAEWVLQELATALGRVAVFTEAPAQLTYSREKPSQGVWIPAQDDAQAFFESRVAAPGPQAYVVKALTLVFAPSQPGEPVPGDIVASAFFLMARWDEWCTSERDEFGRLRLGDSSFARIAGLDLEEPAVEGYIARLREQLGIPAPTTWRVFLTHDIDRIRRHRPIQLAGMVKRGGPLALRTLAHRDPWNNIPDLLFTTTKRGLAPTVYLIGRNRHKLDGTPQAVYERQRVDMARAVHAAGGEVGLHGSFASSEDREALRDELRWFRAETGLPINGIRYHYLRFRYHETVRWLEDVGITYDASLGFSAAPGYAAGLARPFRPYLIGEERPANLQLVPLAVMDVSLHSHLKLDAAAAGERARKVLDATRRAGGASSLLWHNTYLADDRAPGYAQLWEDLLDGLIEAGADVGPVIAPDAPHGERLEGRRVRHVTSVHRPRDVRIFHKEANAALRAGADTQVLALDTPVRRGRRLLAGWKLVRRAAREDADIYHVHDPELLPAALWLSRHTGKKVIYDVHEYLGETVRTKTYIPSPIRLPLAWIAERAERAAALRLDGVVGVNEDLAARFAHGGQRTVAITNAPWGDAFPVPPPSSEPIVLYVGGLSNARGLQVMKDAFALVTHPGARLILVGPGDPGDLAPNIECLGVVDHSEVAALLARAQVSWVPVQRHGNYAKAVLTKLVEAMASARPVVVSDFGRIAHIVRTTGCGIPVQADSPADHAQAIDRLLGDPDLAISMGRAGRATFEDGWAFEQQADRLTAFYEELLRDGR